jgi:hypothetical protein
MRILTKSRRVKQAFRTAWRRLPPEDRGIVAGFVRWVQADREWGLGFSGELNPESAGLYPLFGVDERPAGILFRLTVARLFSDAALIGIAAHELAHARRAAAIGKDWNDAMRTRYGQEERAADRLAMQWGFSAEIHIKDEERRRIVNPQIERWSAEGRIARAIYRRDREQEARFRVRFGLSSEQDEADQVKEK